MDHAGVVNVGDSADEAFDLRKYRKIKKKHRDVGEGERRTMARRSARGWAFDEFPCMSAGSGCFEYRMRRTHREEAQDVAVFHPRRDEARALALGAAEAANDVVVVQHSEDRDLLPQGLSREVQVSIDWKTIEDSTARTSRSSSSASFLRVLTATTPQPSHNCRVLRQGAPSLRPERLLVPARPRGRSSDADASSGSGVRSWS